MILGSCNGGLCALLCRDYYYYYYYYYYHHHRHVFIFAIRDGENLRLINEIYNFINYD